LTGSVGIIGAGIFGVTAALELSNNGIAVTLYEKHADILDGTTSRNFFRLHRGYHYPRDLNTARQARDGYESFSRIFAEALVPSFPHYYAIAAEESLVTAEQFQEHCDQLGLRAYPVELSVFVPGSTKACFEVDESYYDASELKRLSWKRLITSHVQVELNCMRQMRVISQAHDIVIVTAYASLNQVLDELSCPLLELQYEVCETPIIHAPSLHRCSITVIDGPFVSIASYGTGLHVLYDVIHSVHTQTVGYDNLDSRSYACQFDGPLVSHPVYTKFDPILSSAQRFVAPLENVNHVGSLIAERIVLPHADETDARPTEIWWVAPRVIAVLSGKVCVAIDAARTITRMIAGELMTRVLITGAGGFAGHHLMQHVLVNTDWDIIATDSFRHKGKTDRIAIILNWYPEWRERVTIITHDLTAPFSEQSAQRIAGDAGLDFIVAMASESHVDRSITHPVPFVQNNVDLMLSTLELARLLRPQTVLHISTDEVYGSVTPGQAHSEWDPVIPSNPYSASKVAQEALAISYWRTYDVPVIITNTVNMYGERQEPEKFLPLLIRSIVSDDEVQIHGIPGNIGSRYYLHARNASSAWLFLLKNVTAAMFPDAPYPDRYNISSAEPASNLEFAQAVAEVAGKPLRYKLIDFHSARPGHDPHYGLDTSKLTSLGWEPPIEFHESLKQTIKWTLDHPEWLL
jgi:dTDP-glucose 4,6-dehydratase